MKNTVREGKQKKGFQNGQKQGKTHARIDKGGQSII